MYLLIFKKYIETEKYCARTKERMSGFLGGLYFIIHELESHTTPQTSVIFNQYLRYRYMRKSSMAWGKAVAFSGYSGLLHP